MRHLAHVLAVAISIVAAAVPAALADPAVVSVIANHPVIAAYLPVVSGVIYALYRAVKPSRVDAGIPSSGAPTMGAKP